MVSELSIPVMRSATAMTEEEMTWVLSKLKEIEAQLAPLKDMAAILGVPWPSSAADTTTRVGAAAVVVDTAPPALVPTTCSTSGSDTGAYPVHVPEASLLQGDVSLAVPAPAEASTTLSSPLSMFPEQDSSTPARCSMPCPDPCIPVVAASQFQGGKLLTSPAPGKTPPTHVLPVCAVPKLVTASSPSCSMECPNDAANVLTSRSMLGASLTTTTQANNVHVKPEITTIDVISLGVPAPTTCLPSHDCGTILTDATPESLNKAAASTTITTPWESSPTRSLWSFTHPKLTVPMLAWCSMKFLDDNDNIKLQEDVSVYMVSTVQGMARMKTFKMLAPWDPGGFLLSMGEEHDYHRIGEHRGRLTIDTGVLLSVPWDPGSYDAPAWGQAEFQGRENVTAVTATWAKLDQSPSHAIQRPKGSNATMLYKVRLKATEGANRIDRI